MKQYIKLTWLMMGMILQLLYHAYGFFALLFLIPIAYIDYKIDQLEKKGEEKDGVKTNN
jgi:hypothetical protein